LDNIEISILTPSKGGLARKESFARLIESLTNTCSLADAKRVEVLIKVDSSEIADDYRPILEKSPFPFFIITESETTGYDNLHKIFNKLCNQSHGNFYWLMGDDHVVTGDWFQPVKKSRNSWKDNIYVLGYTQGKLCSCPIITKEWFNACRKRVSPAPPCDTWIWALSNNKRVKRHKYCPYTSFGTSL